jgi:hypothetical protein
MEDDSMSSYMPPFRRKESMPSEIISLRVPESSLRRIVDKRLMSGDRRILLEDGEARKHGIRGWVDAWASSTPLYISPDRMMQSGKGFGRARKKAWAMCGRTALPSGYHRCTASCLRERHLLRACSRISCMGGFAEGYCVCG